MSEKIISFLSDIMVAMSNCSLYSKEHPAVMYLSEKAAAALDTLFIEEKFSMALLGDSIIINEQSLPARHMHVSSCIKKLKRKGIDKIVISRGVTAAELKDFISEIALSDRITGSYPHITSGIIEVKLGGGGGGDIGAVMTENIEKVKSVYHGVSRFKRLDMIGLEDVVVSFITTLKQEANVLNVVSPIKAHSEYTYAHNTNVAVLSIFQAETLGVKHDLLHDIGMAGLLHDIGKMFVPAEVLEKEAKLNEEEWVEMKKHPVYGAMYLATLPDIPKYALVATYEHHMKFNGQGYPATRRKGRTQHIISQIIAISDFFDALRTDRPYRKALDVPVIIGLMNDSSGKDFNPLLVENFIRSLKKVNVFSS
ncbi:MAG: HD domain-containing protein [Nitrospirae bacterium]|nr:HD domain-containing protein [Nitrospirota bacterium]